MILEERELSSAEYAQVQTGFEAHALEFGNPPTEERRLTFVATEDDELAGCASGLINENGKWLYLTDLFVVNRLRRHGLGSQLLTAIEEKAKSLGVKTVWTRTAGYEAPDFYTKQGYSRLFELHDWYQSGHSQLGFYKSLDSHGRLSTILYRLASQRFFYYSGMVVGVLTFWVRVQRGREALRAAHLELVDILIPLGIALLLIGIVLGILTIAWRRVRSERMRIIVNDLGMCVAALGGFLFGADLTLVARWFQLF